MFLPDPLVIAAACALDLTIGDTRWLPHPVILIGRLISTLESLLRRSHLPLKGAGVLLMLLTAGITAGATATLLYAAGQYLPHAAAVLIAIIISSTCLAARSLHRESAVVAEALFNGDIQTARTRLAWIVGRDTDQLEEPEIWRALIETVAENTADGIISPLFWLAAGGPVACMAFKAVSTLDSMVGYKNERFIDMGWASARMDDLLNLIPARLTAGLMVFAAPLTRLSFGNALKITLRDRHNHPSPNSAHPESAAAGALGIRLGGNSTYSGKLSVKQHIGDPLHPIDGNSYRGMIRLMYASTLLMTLLSVAAVAILRGTYGTHL